MSIVLGERHIARLVRVPVIAAGATVSGAALVAVASRFHGMAPLVILALPLVPVVALLILADARLGVALVYAAIPFGFAFITVGFLRLQAVDIAVLAAVVLIALGRLALGKLPLGWAPALSAYTAFLLWALVAMPSAGDRVLAIKEMGYLADGLLFAGIMLAACRDLDDLRRLLAVLVAVAVPVSFQAVASLGQLQVFFGGTVFSGRAQGLFTEPNELGFFTSMVIFAAAGLALSARTRWGRRAATGSMLVLLVALALSLSRGAWMGTAAGIVLLLVAVPVARKLVFRLGLLVMVLLALLAVFAPSNPDIQILKERARTFANPAASFVDQRPAIWREALREIQADPWTGQGPGNYQIGVGGSASPYIQQITTHAHNIYLTTAAEEGLPGLLLFVVFFIALAVTARRGMRDGRRDGRDQDVGLLVACGAGVFAFAVHGMVNGTLGNTIVDVVFWSVAGGLLVARRELARTSPPTATG